MILKKLKLKAKNNSVKSKTSKFYSIALTFLLCTLCCSTTVSYAETSSKSFAAQIDKESFELDIVQKLTMGPSQQLWQARIANPKYRQVNKDKNDLQQIIEQINSIAFKAQSQTIKPLIVTEPIQKAEPNKIAPEAENLQEIEPNTIEPEVPDKNITEQTLRIFKKLSQNLGQLQQPFELAEILFASNCLKEAASCYRQALSRVTAKTSDQAADKAWILFQIGNCLRTIDPLQAMQMYKQLIYEYPESPWVDLAKTKNKLINWYLTDKPNTLINERKVSVK